MVCKATCSNVCAAQTQAAQSNVSGLFETKFSASDDWHDITISSKCGEGRSAPPKETDTFTNKLPTDGVKEYCPFCGFQFIITISCNNLNTVIL
jgi:hypothetical protein